MDKAIETIRRLYKRFGEFECLPGCTDCCDGGPPLFATQELDAIPQWLMRRENAHIKSEVTTDPITGKTGIKICQCPFADMGRGCTIYEFRPLTCRAFGGVEGDLICPHGRGLKRKMSAHKWRKTLMEYQEAAGADGLGMPLVG